MVQEKIAAAITKRNEVDTYSGTADREKCQAEADA